ncbi:MAG TPA: hypothetical protein VNW99_01865 [Cytophagaceae bacterium]|jgi:hypothetical protein|nr:hypothetical protein [Cytophagaceae bacterium]
MKTPVDNFDLVKEEFEIRFKKKWDKNPELFISYYQVRVLDAILLHLTQKESDQKLNEQEELREIGRLKKIFTHQVKA